MATAAKASQGIDFGSDAEADSSGLDTGTLLGVVAGIGAHCSCCHSRW